MADLTDFSDRKSLCKLDARISRVLQAMQRYSSDLTPAALAASSIGLSSSRFQHLFAEQVGVPYRRYRAWHRLRVAFAEIVAGSNFTTAAHAAGFSDQAHFANSFRRTFGASPSPSLQLLRN